MNLLPLGVWLALGTLDAAVHVWLWLYAPPERVSAPDGPLTVALGIALCIVLGPFALALTALEIRAVRRAGARRRGKVDD